MIEYQHITVTKTDRGTYILEAQDNWWIYNEALCVCVKTVYLGRTGRMEDWAEVDHYIEPPQFEDESEEDLNV